MALGLSRMPKRAKKATVKISTLPTKRVLVICPCLTMNPPYQNAPGTGVLAWQTDGQGVRTHDVTRRALPRFVTYRTSRIACNSARFRAALGLQNGKIHDLQRVHAVAADGE